MIYIALNFALTSFASWLERRLRRAKKSTGAVLTADDNQPNAGATAGGGGAL